MKLHDANAIFIELSFSSNSKYYFKIYCIYIGNIGLSQKCDFFKFGILLIY